MFNKRIVFTIFALVAFFGLGTGTAWAQPTTDTVVVTYEVTAVTQINLNGAASVTIVAGTPGSGLPSVTDSSGVTYDITNNAGAESMRLTGKIDIAMPANTTLSVSVTAPSGAVSAGFVDLTATDQDLVTGIDNVDEAAVAISFRLAATVAAGVLSSATKTFTMTIVAT